MSYFLPHLTNGIIFGIFCHSIFFDFLGWQVDQAILSEEDRVVIMRFGRDYVTI